MSENSSDQLIEHHARLNDNLWENLSAETVVSRANLGMAAYKWAEQKLTPADLQDLKKRHLPASVFTSPELPAAKVFRPIKSIDRQKPIGFANKCRLQFQDVDGRIYSVPVELAQEPVTDDSLNNPQRGFTLWLNERRLVKGRDKSVRLGSRKLQVPIATLARLVKVFEFIGDSHFDSLPKIAHESGDVAVRWNNFRGASGEIPFALSPYLLIARQSTNIEQTPATFAQALALTTNNKISLQV